ncbi:MAG: DNA-binding domain-containing protein [Albidovulum sp.]
MSQSAFRQAILDPALPVPDGLTDPQGRPAGRRFNVYRNNVTVSLTEALRQAFPVVLKLVGEDFFTAMAQIHLRAHPPKTPLMMYYGADMPAFLQGFAPVAHLGYLPDIARLELALRQSYHAADSTALPAETLSALAPDILLSSRLVLAPALQLIRSDWPVHSIWMANARNTPPPKAMQAEDVLVTRPGFDPEPLLLPAGAATFIATLQAGQRFDAAFDAAGDFDLTATLEILISGGAITEILPGETP